MQENMQESEKLNPDSPSNALASRARWSELSFPVFHLPPLTTISPGSLGSCWVPKLNFVLDKKQEGGNGILALLLHYQSVMILLKDDLYHVVIHD